MSISRLLRPFSLGLAALLLAACSSTPKAPEPEAYPALPADKVKMQRLWRVSVGKGLEKDDVRLAPAVGEQRIIAASRDGVLMAIERETGKVVWKKETGLAITAGPAAAYGLIAVGTSKGEVVAFAETDGSQSWKVQAGAAVLASPAVAADAVVVMSTDGVIRALERSGGEVRWAYNTVVPPLSLRANAPPLIDDGRVYVATSGGKLVGLDMVTGVAGWDLRVATNTGRSELERMNDIVGDLLQSSDGTLYSVGYQSQLTATDVDAGRRRWQFDASSVNGLAEGLGNVYFTDVSGHVLAVDQASGKAVWKQSDYAWRQLTAPAVVGSVLAVGDNKGKLHLLAQSDGQVRGRISVSGDALVALTGRGDVLYCWDVDGRLSAWRIRPDKS